MIQGDEQIVLTLWYRRSELTLVMYPIIIVDIAPKIPGSLTHFNWPRLLSDKPIYRVYHKITIGWLHMYATATLQNAENDTFSLGLNMLLT